MKWIDDLLQVKEEVKGLVYEFIESVRPDPPIDNRMISSYAVVSCVGWGFSGVKGVSGSIGIQGVAWDRNFEDAVFRGSESIPKDLFDKRVEEFRKKYPEDFSSIEKMEKIVYGDSLLDKVELIKKEVKSDGGIFRMFKSKERT